MPESYQPPLRRDEQSKTTHSQTVQSNLSAKNATVQNLLDRKGNEVFSIGPSQTLGTAVELLRDKGIGALIVVGEDGSLEGILSERDIVRKLADTPGRTLLHRVDAVMTSSVETCTTDETLESVMRRMTNGRFRHMPVRNDGRLLGMVSIGDVVNYRLNQLEHEALQLKQLIVG